MADASWLPRGKYLNDGKDVLRISAEFVTRGSQAPMGYNYTIRYADGTTAYTADSEESTAKLIGSFGFKSFAKPNHCPGYPPHIIESVPCEDPTTWDADWEEWENKSPGSWGGGWHKRQFAEA